MTFLDRKTSTFIILIFFSLCYQAVRGRGYQNTLAEYSYRELDNLIYESRHDSVKLFLYLGYYLQKAQIEKHKKELVNYYKDYVFYQKEEDRLSFIDSALLYAHSTNDQALIGDAYLIKGIVFYNIKDYQQALDHYLIANDYIAQADDIYNKYRIKNMIGSIKNYLGHYEDAEALFKECIRYFVQEESSYNMHRGYISSMLGLAWSYTKTDRLSESVQMLAKARESAEKMGFSELDVHYLVFKQGINDYWLGDYDQAIQKIAEKLPFLYDNEDFAWSSIGEFYIGKSWWDQGDQERAISYFKKIDEVFQSQNYIHPDLREAYELLITYYKTRGDKDGQLKYIGQLVQADRVFSQNHKYLLSTIYKKYTVRELSLTKIELETALYAQKNKTALIIIVSISLLLLALTWIYNQRRRTKKTVQELIQKVKTTQVQPESVPLPAVKNSKNSGKAPAQMKEEVVELLLNKLEQFEEKQKFLKPNITLEKLAANFGTNTSYLSQVINTYKKQSFTQYLNTLRVEYAITDMVLNKDSVFFKYAIESSAEQVGYNNAAAFSRAFQNHVGILPSAFIREIKRDSA